MKIKKNLKFISISTTAISMIAIPSIIGANIPSNVESAKNISNKTENIDWQQENNLIFGERLDPLSHFNKYGTLDATKVREDREYYYIGLDLDTAGLKLNPNLDGIYIRMYGLDKTTWKYDINLGEVAYYPSGYVYGGWANSGYKEIKIKKTESGRWVKFRVLFPRTRDIQTIYSITKYAKQEFYIEPLRHVPKFKFEVLDRDKRVIDGYLNYDGYFMVNDKINWKLERFDETQKKYVVISEHQETFNKYMLTKKSLHFDINKIFDVETKLRISGSVTTANGYILTDFSTNDISIKGLKKDENRKEVPFDIFDLNNIQATNKSSLSLLVNNIIDGGNKSNPERALQEIYNRKLLWGIFLGDSVAAKYGVYALEEYASLSVEKIYRHGVGYKWYVKLKTEPGYKFKHNDANGKEATEVYKWFVVEFKMVEPVYPPEILE